MDHYSIEDSLRDGATKAIHYEVRRRTGSSPTPTSTRSLMSCSRSVARRNARP